MEPFPTPPFEMPILPDTFDIVQRVELPQTTRGALSSFVSGWWILLITVLTALPWAIVAVWDAIDADYRPRYIVAIRLFVSSICLLVAYIAGIIFCIVLSNEILSDREKGRHDEVATVLVLLIFNIWHVSRNWLGWSQFIAINKLASKFELIQRNFGDSYSGGVKLPRGRKVFVQGLDRLRISERLFDNDWRRDIPYLSPLFKYGRVGNDDDTSRKSNEAWAIATWRAWWTQDVKVMGKDIPNLDTDGYEVSKQHRHPTVENLTSTTRPTVEEGVFYNGRRITSNDQWAKALATYGGPEGQQDTHGEPLTSVLNITKADGVALLVHEKTTRVPNRMAGLWYSTAKFEELYEKKVRDLAKDDRCREILFPSWSGWLRIAQDIGTHLPRPVYLSDVHLENFAGELASASVILVKYPRKYAELVKQIEQDGLNARWTFGWSGLLACFSQLWTFERIYIAMLNGLSLLALSSKTDVNNLDGNVRSLLYGYAAFEVSDRAVGRKIANDRKNELLKRYRKNSGKTCRGSGLHAVRLACEVLGLPADASHMDGLPSFSTGWCSEYMERQPGNQTPAHGKTHDEVERRQGSSNAWRYPHSHT